MVTTVVVTLIERDHGDRESEWRPAVTKAKAWLARQGASIDVSPVIGAG